MHGCCKHVLALSLTSPPPPPRVAFRAYQVLTQPVEKLVQVLGLEVPVAPLVSLAGIKADGLLLHWKPPDQRTSVLKYVIRINGIDSTSRACRHPRARHIG